MHKTNVHCKKWQKKITYNCRHYLSLWGVIKLNYCQNNIVPAGTNITLHLFQQKKYYNIYSWWNKQYRIFATQRKNIHRYNKLSRGTPIRSQRKVWVVSQTSSQRKVWVVSQTSSQRKVWVVSRTNITFYLFPILKEKILQ